MLISVLLAPNNGHYVANLNEGDTPKKPLVAEKQETEIVANIRFYKDRRVSGNQYFGITDDGVTVFPNWKLADAITKQGLKGYLLPVTIKPRISELKGVIQYYTAFSEDLRQTPHLPKLDWKRTPSAILIDGQNLLGTFGVTPQKPLKKMVKSVQRLAPSCTYAKMFFCSQSAQSHQSWIKQLAGLKNIKLVDRAPKIINGGHGPIRKNTDIDTEMLPEIPYLKLDVSIQVLIVVTGDSDYEKALRMWAGIGEYEKTGQRLLIIVSWAKNLSKELRALGNHPNVEIIELEDLM